MKALLISTDADFPKTHDLVLLYNLLNDVHKKGISIRALQPLNRYAIEARYPGDWEIVDKVEAVAALKKAGKIRTFARKALREFF